MTFDLPAPLLAIYIPLLGAFLIALTGRWQNVREGVTLATALALLERKRGELFGSLTIRNKRRFLRVDRLVANTDWPFEEGSAEGQLALAAERLRRERPCPRSAPGARASGSRHSSAPAAASSRSR